MHRYLTKFSTPFGGLLVLAVGAGAIMGAESVMDTEWRDGTLAGAAAVGVMLLGGAALVTLPVWFWWGAAAILEGTADRVRHISRSFLRPPSSATPSPRRATTVPGRLLASEEPTVRAAPPRPRSAPPVDTPQAADGAVELAVRCLERGHAYPTHPLGRGDRGYVYVLANHSMPGVFKVGQTNRDPLQRARKLHTTGVPIPFLCVYSRPSAAPRRVEAIAHRSLRASRLSSSREFFASDLRTVVIAVEEAARLVERTARRAPSNHS